MFQISLCRNMGYFKFIIYFHIKFEYLSYISLHNFILAYKIINLLNVGVKEIWGSLEFQICL
jgi:hypothetical protein